MTLLHTDQVIAIGTYEAVKKLPQVICAIQPITRVHTHVCLLVLSIEYNSHIVLHYHMYTLFYCTVIVLAPLPYV